MVAHVWQFIIVILAVLTLFTGCASSPYVGTGAAVGGGLGALTGAAIGHRNPWGGALVGGLVGSALGAGTGYLIQQRQTPAPPEGYYNQPAPPGYGAPPPPAYGYRTPPPAPGPSYGYNRPTPGPARSSLDSWNTPAPVTPPGTGYGNGNDPQARAYSQEPVSPNVRGPMAPAPYYPEQ